MEDCKIIVHPQTRAEGIGNQLLEKCKCGGKLRHHDCGILSILWKYKRVCITQTEDTTSILGLPTSFISFVMNDHGLMQLSQATPKLVRFDWAIKYLLRNKANIDILEGFLSELLKTPIHIEQILESESNKNHAGDKFNRVDLLVKAEGKLH